MYVLYCTVQVGCLNGHIADTGWSKTVSPLRYYR